MANYQLKIPTLRKPVQEYLTPDHSVGFFSELIDRTDPAYKTPVRGMPYSSIRDAKPWVVAAFPNLVFLKESRWEENDQLVVWTFATDPAAEDTYNADVTYSGDSSACPVYTRVYTVRREAYDTATPVPVGTPLKTIISLNVTAQGTGYTTATVTASNGAKITPVISGGKIVSLVLTAQGTDVTSPPTITITGDGAGATATATIQSQSAVLVKQKKVEFPEGHPFRNEYVQVARVYETLPGPNLSGQVVTADGQVGTLTRQTVTPSTSVTPSALMVSGSVQPDGAGKSVLETVTVPSVFPETQKSASQPTKIPEMFFSSPVTQESSVAAGTDTTPAVGSGGLGVIEQSKQAVTAHKVKTTTTTAPASTEAVVTQKQGVWGKETVTRTVENSNAITPAHLMKSAETTPLSPNTFIKTVEVIETPATLVEVRTDEETGLVIKMEKSLVDPASSLPGGVGVTKLVERQPIDKWHSIQIVSSRLDPSALPSPETYTTVAQISLPNFLEAVGIFWESMIATDTDTSSVIGASSYPPISWHLGATAKANASINGAGWVKIKEGYRGAAHATVTRTYHNSPPSDVHAIHKFTPVNGQLIVKSAAYYRSGSSNKGGYANDALTQGSGNSSGWNGRVQYVTFSGVEHNSPGVTVTGSNPITASATASAGSTPAGGSYPAASAESVATGTYELVLPVSSIPLTSGDTFIQDVNVRKWKFGIWVKEVITAKVP